MKPNMLLTLGLLLAAVLIGGVVLAKKDSSGVRKISAEEAHTLMQQQDVIIVDVRTQEEYEEGHIPDAILIPNETIRTEPEQLPDKNATILVYCRSGNRSAQASKKLVKLGYQNIIDFGGINSWPYEIVR